MLCSCLFNEVKAFLKIYLLRSVLIVWRAATNKSMYGKHCCPYIAGLCLYPHGFIERSSAGKPQGRQPKQPRHGTDVAGVINISDDCSTESDVLDSDSNSSPDSVQDNNDDVIFVDQTSYQMGMLTVYFMVRLILSPRILMIFTYSTIEVSKSNWSSLSSFLSTVRGEETRASQQDCWAGKRTTS